MSLASLVTKATATAFAAAGDLVKTVTWRQETAGEYDVATARVIVTKVDNTVSAIVCKLDRIEAERLKVSARSFRLVIKGQGLDGITPAENDQVILDGSIYEVKSLSWAGTKDVWNVIADFLKPVGSDFAASDFSSDFA